MIDVKIFLVITLGFVTAEATRSRYLDAQAKGLMIPVSMSGAEEDERETCLLIQPPPRDYVKRLYAILPAFDRSNSNSAFLNDFRHTIRALSETNSSTYHELAFIVATITPILFLQNDDDVWCVLGQFNEALKLFQKVGEAEKKSSLYILESIKDMSRRLLRMLSEDMKSIQKKEMTATSLPGYMVDEKRNMNVKYVKELIKNFG